MSSSSSLSLVSWPCLRLTWPRRPAICTAGTPPWDTRMADICKVFVCSTKCPYRTSSPVASCLMECFLGVGGEYKRPSFFNLEFLLAFLKVVENTRGPASFNLWSVFTLLSLVQRGIE